MNVNGQLKISDLLDFFKTPTRKNGADEGEIKYSLNEMSKAKLIGEITCYVR